MTAQTQDPRLIGWTAVYCALSETLSPQRQIVGITLGGQGYNYWLHSDNDLIIALQDAVGGYHFIIRRRGTLYPTKAVRRLPREQRRALWNDLCALRENPLEFLAKHGKSTGTCIVCGKRLTDPVSVAAGIGPWCSNRVRRAVEDVSQKNLFDEFK